MAIDLVGLLTGNNSLENQYQANDPWYQAARGIGGLQLAPGTNNTEAFLLPFLQGATAGGLAGYGRHSAQQTAYKDISSALNNIGYQPSAVGEALAADQIQYGLDEMPENFSIKASTPDLLLALSQQSAKQEAAAKAQEIRNKLEIESSLPFLEQIKAAEKAKAAGKLEGEMPNMVGIEGADPLMIEIQKKVPQQQLNTALKEKGTIDQLRTGFDRIDQLMTEGAKASQDVSTLLPSEFSLPLVGKIADLPTSEAAKELETVKAGITSVALSVWKGPLDEKDAKRILEPYFPTMMDTEATLEKKRQGLKELLTQNAEATPVLSGYGVTSRPSTSGGMPAPKPGFKVQRNSKTGEYRQVPL